MVRVHDGNMKACWQAQLTAHILKPQARGGEHMGHSIGF